MQKLLREKVKPKDTPPLDMKVAGGAVTVGGGGVSARGGSRPTSRTTSRPVSSRASNRGNSASGNRPSSSGPRGVSRSLSFCCSSPRKAAATYFIQLVIDMKLMAMGGQAGILFSYVHKQDIAGLKELFDKEPGAAVKAANTLNEFGETAATFAASEGLVEVVKVFLQRGLDLSTKRNAAKVCDDHAYTPLYRFLSQSSLTIS